MKFITHGVSLRILDVSTTGRLILDSLVISGTDEGVCIQINTEKGGIWIDVSTEELVSAIKQIEISKGRI